MTPSKATGRGQILTAVRTRWIGLEKRTKSSTQFRSMWLYHNMCKGTHEDG